MIWVNDNDSYDLRVFSDNAFMLDNVPFYCATFTHLHDVSIYDFIIT